VHSPKMMIVEDEILIASLFQKQFLKWGYDVFDPVSSGEEAVEIADKVKPDVILVDICLKGTIDGIDAIKTIQSKGNKFKVIFVSGYLDKDTLNRAKKLNPWAIMAKPLSLSDLKQTVETALRKN